MSEDDRKLCLKALKIMRNDRVIAGYTYDGIKACIVDSSLSYDEGDDPDTDAVKKSPVQIVEEIEKGVRAGMNPYCLSVPEEYVLNVITTIKNELREAGYDS